jgi:heptosyltransferase-2
MAGYVARMFAVRAPDHLGDGVMALPAVYAIAALGPTRVYAPGWGTALYEGLDVRARTEPPPAGATGVLLKPSFGAAWRWRTLPRRVGLVGHGRSWLLTDPVPPRAEHRRQGYARVAAVVGANVPAATRYAPRGQAEGVPPGFAAFAAWGATPAARWPHMRSLADRVAMERPVMFLAGPGEETAVRAVAGPHPVLALPALPDLAAALDRAAFLVGNDTGLTHFAAACGVPVVTVHGSTDPSVTSPGGPVLAAERPWCAPCWRKTCPIDLRCLTRVTVDAVLDACRVAARDVPGRA